MSHGTIQGTNEYRLAIKNGKIVLQRKMEEVFYDDTDNPFPKSVTHKWVDCETVIIDAEEGE